MKTGMALNGLISEKREMIVVMNNVTITFLYPLGIEIIVLYKISR